MERRSARDTNRPKRCRKRCARSAKSSTSRPRSRRKLRFCARRQDLVADSIAEDGTVEIPRWRHAIINFPHPLLQQGLVILDTPGLNAIGTEPELTLSLLPNAHAVLFILAADTGVTQSDLAIWNEHIARRADARKGASSFSTRSTACGTSSSRKTKSTPRSPNRPTAARGRSICRQARSSRSRRKRRWLPRSTTTTRLLERSRLPELELALSNELIPAKQDIVRENTDAEFSDIYMRSRGLLESRLAGLREQLGELNELRGKNKGVVEYMMGKVRVEKEEFESGLQRYYAVRSVFSQMTNRLFAHLGLDALRQLTASTRARCAKRRSRKRCRGDEEVLQHRTRQSRQLGRRNLRNPVDDGSHLQEVRSRARPQARYADELLADPLPKGNRPP
jgi:hypothetical protein